MPCNGNGQCDLTIGVCSCDEGHQGSDCSGNTFDNENIFLAAGSRQASSRNYLFCLSGVGQSNT